MLRAEVADQRGAAPSQHYGYQQEGQDAICAKGLEHAREVTAEDGGEPRYKKEVPHEASSDRARPAYPILRCPFSG